MIILTTTSDKIRVKLAAAGTAVQLVACWRDITSTTYLPARAVAPSIGETEVDLVASPAASHQLKVDFLSAYNADSVGHTVTFEFWDGSNAYPLWIGTLGVGEMVTYQDGRGWAKQDSVGNVVQKTVFTAMSSAELAGMVSDETGTGALVFANAPTLVAPILGTPASGNLVNCTGIVKTAQVVVTELTADFSTAATIPYDATIPQSGEGTEYITAAITPTNASSTLEIEMELCVGGSAGAIFIAALFKDSDANALWAWGGPLAGNIIYPFRMSCRVSAGSTSARTYKLRVGSNGVTAYINRSSGTADLFGATPASRLIVREILP